MITVNINTEYDLCIIVCSGDITMLDIEIFYDSITHHPNWHREQKTLVHMVDIKSNLPFRYFWRTAKLFENIHMSKEANQVLVTNNGAQKHFVNLWIQVIQALGYSKHRAYQCIEEACKQLQVPVAAIKIAG